MQPLDTYSEEMHEDYNPSVDTLIDMIDADVHSQGIGIDHRDFLDMGSPNWPNTPDTMKSAAYQALTYVGKWDDERISQIIMAKYKHIKPSIMKMTIEILKDLSQKNPLIVEEPDAKIADVQIKRHEPS